MIENLEKKELEKIIMNDVLEGGEILKVKDDRTFKTLFNGNDKLSLSWFISNMIDCNIHDIKDIMVIGNNELTPLNMHDKKKYVDFLVHINDDLVVVELNNNNTGRNYLRNLYYTFHALLNTVESSDKYTDKIYHAYLINLNWFNDNDKHHQNMEGIQIVEYPYPILDNNTKPIITVKNINLSFYDKQVYNGVKEKDFLWKLFTIDKIKDIKDVSKNIKELHYYCSEIERLSKSKEYCKMVWSEKLETNLRNIDAYHNGHYEGKEEGKEEKAREMIINMNNDNVPIDVIAKYAELPIEEVSDIINNHNQ